MKKYIVKLNIRFLNILLINYVCRYKITWTTVGFKQVICLTLLLLHNNFSHLHLQISKRGGVWQIVGVVDMGDLGNDLETFLTGKRERKLATHALQLQHTKIFINVYIFYH